MILLKIGNHTQSGNRKTFYLCVFFPDLALHFRESRIMIFLLILHNFKIIKLNGHYFKEKKTIVQQNFKHFQQFLFSLSLSLDLQFPVSTSGIPKISQSSFFEAKNMDLKTKIGLHYFVRNVTRVLKQFFLYQDQVLNTIHFR